MSIRAMGPAAALVGVLPTVQPQGVWTGRRQLVVRFAGEAETAVMYSAAALAEEMRRLAGRATFHSIALSGPVIETDDARWPSLEPKQPRTLGRQLTTRGSPQDHLRARRVQPVPAPRVPHRPPLHDARYLRARRACSAILNIWTQGLRLSRRA